MTYVQDYLPGMEDKDLIYPPEIIHGIPDRAGEFYTFCCGMTLFELPRTDRITLDISHVTCGTV